MKTAMELALARIEMLYIEKDSVHWEMFKNDCMEKEKEQIINAHTNAYLIGEDDISVEDANKASEQYYNQTYNLKKEEQLSLLAKEAQELNLGYEEFELGGEG